MDHFKDYSWALVYKTSSLKADGTPVDILQDFYIPALQRAVKYDRVAGYFRSTSLAAASEGFTAFLTHGGTMRLITGVDLSVHDVEAILAGKQGVFSEKLLEELAHEEKWSDKVKNGISLLAQMVAAGRLELRVAVRINSKTGEAVPFDYTGDGYVHEKWFIMEDESGDKLYGSGSLNESLTALEINAENIDVNCSWESSREKQRVDSGITDFNRLWVNKHPSFRVFKLPEAVKNRIVKLKYLRHEPTEIDGTTLSRLKKLLHIQDKGEVPLKEWLSLAVLKDAPKMPGGEYIGMYSAPVSPWPHQEMVSRRLVESWPYSYLMCDEVGLGKTIEAALAMRSLILSGRAKRILIAAPASLTSQWQRELEEKTLLHFDRSMAKPGYGNVVIHKTLNPEQDKEDTDLYGPDFNIISTGLMRSKNRQQALINSRKNDITLVDEAHYARRSNPQQGCEAAPKYGNLYKCIDLNLKLKAKSLWLATATPMQIDPVEVYDLFRLSKRVGSYCFDPMLSMSYFGLLGKLVGSSFKNNPLNAAEWRMLGQSFHQLQATDPYLWKVLQSTVVNSKNRKALEDIAFTDLKHTADIKDLMKPLFSASPLARVMMRHTRKLLEQYQIHGELKSKLAYRDVLPLATIRFTEEEKNFYTNLQEYCNGLMQQIRQHNPKSRNMMIFLLNFLQLRFASSLYAITETLKRRLQRVKETLLVGGKTFLSQEELDDYIDAMDEDESDLNEISVDSLLHDRSNDDLKWEQSKLEDMLNQLERMKSRTPSKMQYLLNKLNERRISGTNNRLKQTVLFTRFYDTLTSIKMYLENRAPGMRIGVFSGAETSWYNAATGSYTAASRDEIKNLFLRGEIDLLLCTDAAAEGLNLQTADFLINFDLGWNPMKIEQRIGRIDRIGQKHDTIRVLNMCYLGSTEETVYGRLWDRLKKANVVVGTQQVSLLPIKPEEFRDLQAGKISEKELAKIAEQRIKEQQKATAQMELPADKQYEIYKKGHDLMKAQRYPATIDNLWDTLKNSVYLSKMGATWNTDESDSILQIPGSNDEELFIGTIDRNQITDTCSFLTWGNPTVDKILNEGLEHIKAKKKYIRRISSPIDKWEIVGYVVSTTDGPKLITSFNQLAPLELSEVPLSENDIQLKQEELDKLVEKETTVYRIADDIFKVNEKYARLQLELTKQVAIKLLEKQLAAGEDEYFSAIRNIEEHIKEFTFAYLPDAIFGGQGNQLLFQTSSQSGQITMVVPEVLKESAISLCKRTASQIKKNKKDIICKEVIARIKKIV